MITKKISDSGTSDVSSSFGSSRELRPVSPFRTTSAGVMMGHGAFIRARALRGMKVTVATLPLVRLK